MIPEESLMRYYYGSDANLDYAEVNRAVEAVFREHARGQVQMPPKLYITFEHGDFRTMPAYVPALGMAGVKIVNVHPGNRAAGLPTVMALTVILDVETGIPTAVINATRLTDMRTGAAGAIAAKYLAPKREVVLGVIGSGRQAEAQIRAISRELVITEIRVWSRDEKNALALAEQFGDLSASATGIERACDADVVVTTTPSRKPIVMHEWIHDGTHINAIGADAPGKEELDPLILKRARVFVDDRPQAIHSGEINVPITKGLFHAHDIAGTLGEVVVGVKGRRRPEEVTVFDSTGLAIQDLAIGKLAMAAGKRVELPFP
jgi:alanine dehydrogenase